MCGSKKSRFIKKQEAIGLLSSLAIKTSSSQITLVGLFNFKGITRNEKVNKMLLARNTFIPEMHLRQPGFTYSACGPFIKNKEKLRKFKEKGYSRYIYQNELDKA